MPFSNPVVGGGGGLIRNWIQSPDFVTGVSGWRIARDGSAEFNNVVVRGTFSSTNYVPGVSGWYLDQNGNAEFNAVTIRGSWLVIQGAQELRGYIQTLPTSPYDPTPQPTPVVTFNPDTADYAEGFVYAKPLSGDGLSQLVFGSPNYTPAGVTQATAALIQDYAENFNYWDVDGMSSANYHHDKLGQLDENGTSSGAITPGNSVIMATVTADTVDSTWSIMMVMAGWHGITLAGPSATIGNNRVTMAIVADGSQVRACRLILQNTTQTQAGGTLIYVGPPPPSTGNHTFQLRMGHEAASAATSASCNASASSPAWIAVKGF